MRFLGLIFCIFSLAASAITKGKIEKCDFKFESKWRTYYFFAPDQAGPLPLIVLLHGSGRDGSVMANAWMRLASTERFMIVAPDSYDAWAWQSQKDSPHFIRSVVQQVNAKHPVDSGRIYLFGHSGGAVYALMLALVESEYFAATAVHAGALYPENFHLFANAKRHMPIALWVGDRDSFFSVGSVTATKKEFESHGFHVELIVLANQTHSYESVSVDVNDRAWEFLKKTRLEPSIIETRP
jgi:poly(3-hydroxybutyrate) depolymerase